MGYTAVYATLALDHTTPPYALYIDGTYVSLDRTGAHRFGVDIDSIAVQEAGPGGVSSMSFSIDDPGSLLSFADGARVEYWDFTRGWPIFAGWFQAITIVSDFGEQGRRIEITAYGLEALLDECIVPALVVHPMDTDDSGAFRLTLQEYVALICGFGPLRAFGSRNGVDPTAFSSQARPIENRRMVYYQFGLAQLLANVPIDLGAMSLRAAIETLAIDMVYIADNTTATLFLTVDFYQGVRAFLWGGTFSGGPVEWPSDYATITVTDDNVAGHVAAANLSYMKDLSPGTLTTAVYVKGAAAASTGWIVGDTSTGRHEQAVTSSGTTNDDRVAAGQAVLSNRGVSAGRGELDLLAFTPVNAHPGSQLIITDGPQGWAAKTFVVTAITKTFNSDGTQDWHVSFLDPTVSAAVAGPPSVAQMVRTLTRGQN